MLQWPNPIERLNKDKIMDAISDPTWQCFRKSLKGLPTHVKLDKLYVWQNMPTLGIPTATQRRIQVDNYLNALKRGGQLDSQLRVVR